MKTDIKKSVGTGPYVLVLDSDGLVLMKGLVGEKLGVVTELFLVGTNGLPLKNVDPTMIPTSDLDDPALVQRFRFNEEMQKAAKLIEDHEEELVTYADDHKYDSIYGADAPDPFRKH